MASFIAFCSAALDWPENMARFLGAGAGRLVFPALVLAEALNDPTVQLASLGPGSIGGVAVTHIQFWRVLPSRVSSDSVQIFGHLTAVDVYFAAANSLPVAIDFNAHPANNEKVDIPIEVLYGNYQMSNCISFDAHIQKFINNSLLFGLSITSVAVNSGIPASTFSIPATSAWGAQ